MTDTCGGKQAHTDLQKEIRAVNSLEAAGWGGDGETDR
jgi:hypothetical protein